MNERELLGDYRAVLKKLAYHTKFLALKMRHLTMMKLLVPVTYRDIGQKKR